MYIQTLVLKALYCNNAFRMAAFYNMLMDIDSFVFLLFPLTRVKLIILLYHHSCNQYVYRIHLHNCNCVTNVTLTVQ